MTDIAQLGELVRPDAGLVSPSIYFDEEIYRAEHTRIFERGWVSVGHEDMVRNPGDYVTNYIGEIPIIVVRDRAGTVRVFINKCRHRGNTVCLFDRGNVRAFTCSYHGWTYRTDGNLISVPDEKDLYPEGFDKSEWGLEEAASVVNFHGLVFATLSKDAPPFDSWLGEDVRWWLENFVCATPVGGLEMLPGWHRYRSPANWKLIAENFIGDNYHFLHTHASWIRVMREFQEKGILTPMTTSPLRWREATYEVSAGFKTGCPLGLGAMKLQTDALFERDLGNAKELGKDAEEWVRYRYDQMAKALAAYDPRPEGFVNGLLFPNLGLMGYMSPFIGKHFLLFHPRGPAEHEIWQWTMVEKEAPQAAKDIAVVRTYQGQYMAGVVAPDDVENFERIVEASRSRRTWHQFGNYGIRLGYQEDLFPEIPGNVGADPSEVNQREFYRFWLEVMGDELSAMNTAGNAH